jgi:hypothetical protein
MSPEQQRIKIAEACGWKRKPKFDYTRLRPGTVDAMERIEMWGTDNGHLIPFDKIPDYLHSLDAMHEAEKGLLAKHLPHYAAGIRNVLERAIMQSESTPIAGVYEWHATAAQRAEAFLRTLGKWDADKGGKGDYPLATSNP